MIGELLILNRITIVPFWISNFIITIYLIYIAFNFFIKHDVDKRSVSYIEKINDPILSLISFFVVLFVVIISEIFHIDINPVLSYSGLLFASIFAIRKDHF